MPIRFHNVQGKHFNFL